MYDTVLAIHNILRWVVLILGAAALIRALIGWLGGQEWTPADRRLGMFYGISIDIQLLLGLILYFLLSPLTRTALQDFGSAMGNPDLRFFALEHLFYMLLAVVFAHLGSALSRRAPTGAARHRRAAILFGLSLLAIVLGMPWMRPLFPSLGG